MKLTQQQLDEFDRDGVVMLGRVFSDADLAEARSRFDRIFAERVGTTDRGLKNLWADRTDREAQINAKEKSYQMFNIWQHDDWYKSLLYRDDLLDAVGSVLGPDIQLLHDQIFYKPARDGAPTPWHVDNLYWRYEPPNLASIWVALDDVDLENACLHFLPGSHREPTPEAWLVNTGPNRVALYDMKVDESRLRPFIMKAGEALMHHCMTVHGAYTNPADRDRRAL